MRRPLQELAGIAPRKMGEVEGDARQQSPSPTRDTRLDALLGVSTCTWWGQRLHRIDKAACPFFFTAARYQDRIIVHLLAGIVRLGGGRGTSLPRSGWRALLSKPTAPNQPTPLRVLYSAIVYVGGRLAAALRTDGRTQCARISLATTSLESKLNLHRLSKKNECPPLVRLMSSRHTSGPDLVGPNTFKTYTSDEDNSPPVSEHAYAPTFCKKRRALTVLRF